MHPHFLPVYDIIYQSSLFGCSFAQINSRRFNTFMTHQVCKECNVAAPIQKAFCKPMPKRVGINHCRINAILYRQLFQLSRNTSCCDSFTETIQKDTVFSERFVPLKCLSNSSIIVKDLLSP